MKDRVALEVKTEMCLGCGACAGVCPRRAIWFMWGRANINRARCDLCYRCLPECPEAAIREKIPPAAGQVPSMKEKKGGGGG
ncbi:MAG TPA: 4Fe-4S binding protein [Syntrophorhabdaceae bacterium]|jgi:ferredoxin